MDDFWGRLFNGDLGDSPELDPFTTEHYPMVASRVLMAAVAAELLLARRHLPPGVRLELQDSGSAIKVLRNGRQVVIERGHLAGDEGRILLRSSTGVRGLQARSWDAPTSADSRVTRPLAREIVRCALAPLVPLRFQVSRFQVSACR